MDNRQVLLPFVNLRMIPRPHDAATYQYHQLALRMEEADPRDAVHGLLTTLKAASIHPILQDLPFDLRTSMFLFRNLHAALGLVNVNFPDRRRDDCWVGLGGGDASPLHVHYRPGEGEKARLDATLKRFRRVLWKLGCVVPPGMAHVRPMGASVHYAGTLPMRAESTPFSTDGNGASRDLAGLYFVDGTTFPFLPAKNLTFTLMANATRIGEAAF
jgi:choline dehydrogenase-like flavoprotein